MKAAIKNIFGKYPRSTAIAFSAFSFGASAWYAHATLERARTQHPGHIALLQAFPMLIGMGVIFLCAAVAPEKFKTYSEGLRDRKKTWKDFLFFGAIIAIAILAHLWLESKLRELGYET